MLVSVTEIQSFLRCRQQWDFSSRSREALTPIWPSTALHLGTLVHRVGAIWLADPNTKTPLGSIFHDEASKDLATLIRIHNDILGHGPTDLQSNDYWDMVTLGTAMMNNYQAFYKTALPHGFKLIQPEQQIVVPIPNTEHCKCNDPRCSCELCVASEDDYCNAHECKCEVDSHYLEGTLDAIIQDPTDRLFVFERKTYSQRPNLRHLLRDFQFIAYIWILQQTGAVHGGIAYDGLWKRATPPKGKTMSDLFFRYYMMRSPDEVANVETDITNVVNEMANNPKIYRTVLSVKGCIDCSGLIDMCDAKYMDESPPLHKYTTRELSPAFEEFYGHIVGAED